ncbi:MAG: S-adenosylmethionine:tRNA ribosyltransferase-isomerase [Bacteroidota bacterium]|nr:S-adenosylmethionine:tRNA ribosyltransferase-isomerase [Bacteroidota bacterium]
MDKLNNKIPPISIANYTYNLPEERIAKHPLEHRDESKLLYYNKGEIQDSVFKHLAELINRNSLLVFNNSKVIPARIYFEKKTGAKIEVFCLNPLTEIAIKNGNSEMIWKCLVGNLKRWNSDVFLETNIGNIKLIASVISKNEDYVTIKFNWNSEDTFYQILEMIGELPLPPYLKRKASKADEHRYQTTYAQHNGSVAAPTAGLHFTDKVFENLSLKGIETAFTTLHVGAGTFLPIKDNNIHTHVMHAEWIEIEKPFIKLLLSSETIIAVGTTSARLMESIYWIGIRIINKLPIHDNDGMLVLQWEPYQNAKLISKEDSLHAILSYMEINEIDSITGQTQILIVPGYTFKLCKGLITNFHQPNSTLLLLIAAFVGDSWEDIYLHALQHNYRFLSYGDSSLLIP